MKRQPPSTQKKRNRPKDNRVAGEMTLKELMYFKHTPAYVPSNEFKDQMEIDDLFPVDQPMNKNELQISLAQSKLRDSVLNVNMDDILREIDVLLKSSSGQTKSRTSLKWVERLDQLYHDFLYRSIYVQAKDYPGSPSSNSISPSSVDSQLHKKQRLPRKVTRSNRSTKPVQVYNAWMEQKPTQQMNVNTFNHSLKNPVQTQISSPRKKNARPITASDIEHLTKPKFRPSSSSVFSDKGSMRKSELNL
jgi:hypothetical protein